MSGTKEGGKKAATSNKERDPDFYRRIGAIGGRNGMSGGFASSKVGKDGLTGPERARLAGKKGGLASKRVQQLVHRWILVDSMGTAVAEFRTKTDALFYKRNNPTIKDHWRYTIKRKS